MHSEWLLPVHESPESRTLMDVFLAGWTDTGPHRDAVLVLLNNGCGRWLNDMCADHAVPAYTILDMGENIGFIGAVNRGIASSSHAPLVGILNTDVSFVSDRWMSDLLVCMNSSKLTGAVGYNYTPMQIGQKMVIGLLEFSCVLIRREVLDRTGPLDPVFGHGYFDDNDMCLRMILDGWNLDAVDADHVIHHGHMSIDDAKMRRLMHRNYRIFVNKWRDHTNPVVREYLFRLALYLKNKEPWIFDDNVP